MLARWIRTWDSKILRPLLLLIHKGGLTPNMLTVSGLIVMVISGVQLARGDWLVGGLILLIGALLDGID
jgi:phosphatidylglycerophosphate synthase